MLNDATAIAALIGIPAALVTLNLNWRQARHTFEQHYIDRYWTIDDDRIAHDSDLATSEHARRYLRLCEDEFDAMRAGQISWRTWTVWHESLRKGVTGFEICHELDRVGNDEFRWTRCCIRQSSHIGTGCNAVLAAEKHTSHLSRRWRTSLGRWLELVATHQRRVAARVAERRDFEVHDRHLRRGAYIDGGSRHPREGRDTRR